MPGSRPAATAIRAKRDWPKKDWYVWADPKDDGTVPNNWLSVFGGPAWAYQPARRQYYHHKFLRQQPKLSWVNKDAREAALKVLDLLAGTRRGRFSPRCRQRLSP